MSPLILLALVGWIPVALALFGKLPAHRAAIATLALGWMFLPQYAINLPGLPDYGRETALALGLLAGTLIFHSDQWKNFHLHPVDIPVLVYIAVAVPTSVTNGLGFADGASLALERTFAFGVPWIIGRIYFSDPEALRELVLGIFLAGVLYAPFLLYEIAMSPQLHRIFYGFHPHDFSQAKRGGGYRPVGFMQHGLATAMWTGMATLAGFALLRGPWLRSRFGGLARFLPLVVAGMFLLLVLSRSKGALFLTLCGIGLLFLPAKLRVLSLAVLLLLPPAYMISRSTGVWDGQNLIEAAERFAGAERSGSLSYRIYNEEMLVDRAMERPWFGWGRYQRSFVRNEDGELISVPDGMWIVVLGQDGIVGLTAAAALYLLPVFLFFCAVPPGSWKDQPLAPLFFLPLYLLLTMTDNLFNDMFTPVAILTGGAVTGWYLSGAVFSEGTEKTETVLQTPQPYAPRAL